MNVKALETKHHEQKNANKIGQLCNLTAPDTL